MANIEYLRFNALTHHVRDDDKVSIVSNQGLTDAQKRNARDNAGALGFSDLTAYAHSIYTSLTNVTANSSNPVDIFDDQTVTLSFTADSGYSLPNTITVTGASYTWTQSTGNLQLSSATGDVNISIVGEV